ncbi:MAG: beta-lactamase family protein [Planctomycetaceae bacterium]|nr:beta-lactamase family protein [Planctomycetaceae bacterium]
MTAQQNDLQQTTQTQQQTVPADLPIVEPAKAGMDSRRLAVIDEIVDEGLRQEKMPGCVVMVGHDGKIVYHKAFGFRQLVPEKQEMLKDTVFDMASLTKPIATATSVMKLIEDGKMDVNEKVATYIPEFANHGKEVITVRHLLTHTGGLIPDNSLKDYLNGTAEAFQKIHELSLYAEPDSRFVYSDVGFILLGELVEKISGQNVHEFSQQHVFHPLGMTETGYLPSEALRERAVTTETREDRPIIGEVHDPRAYAMGGIAGHAGLFSTATDLAKYCQMMINGGQLDGVRILKPETVALMTGPQQVPTGLRTLGWDMRSPYSSNRGDLFSSAAYGHGGFTGTSMWIDPTQKLFVIFLSNRVHPDGKGSVNPLAGRIGTIAAAAIQTNEDSD